MSQNTHLEGERQALDRAIVGVVVFVVLQGVVYFIVGSLFGVDIANIVFVLGLVGFGLMVWQAWQARQNVKAAYRELEADIRAMGDEEYAEYIADLDVGASTPHEKAMVEHLRSVRAGRRYAGHHQSKAATDRPEEAMRLIRAGEKAAMVVLKLAAETVAHDESELYEVVGQFDDAMRAVREDPLALSSFELIRANVDEDPQANVMMQAIGWCAGLSGLLRGTNTNSDKLLHQLSADSWLRPVLPRIALRSVNDGVGQASAEDG